jgi:diguanylate cyclase (GGDEF)-like protein/PAS domain S-box-containing protein
MTELLKPISLLDGLPHAAWLVALDSCRVVAVNAAAEALLGRSRAALLGVAAQDLVSSPEDAAWWAQAALANSRADTPPLLSDTIVALWPAAAEVDGAPGSVAQEVVPLHVSRSIGLLHLDTAPPGRASHAVVMLFDRSAEHRAQHQRELLLSELQATLEATADGILVTDLHGRICTFNQRFADIWGMPQHLLQQRDHLGVQQWMASQVIPSDTAPYQARVQELLRTSDVVATDRLQLQSAQVLERVTRPLITAGIPQGRVWSFRDLSERIAAEQRIEALTLQDALCGLPNRRRLAQCVAEALSQARRDSTGFALLFIDLDRFREINDSLGQEVGDRVLQTAAQRIQACLRSDDVLARLGGDQFVALVHLADAASAETTARRVLNAVAQPSQLDGTPFTLTCSIGIALAPSQGEELDELLRHAEGAMRIVKSKGRAHCRLHQARAEADRRSHMKLDHAMRQALVSGRFRLHYQPQVELASGRVIGAEALLRWRDPEMGEISPGRFIPVAEDSGFIVAIGDWVLGQAVRQAALWHSRGAPMPVAINVSALQFQQAHFVDRVASVLAVSGLPARLLELELTESILVHDADEALQRLHALAKLGVRLSIDDFGTGYSSLAYLKRFPIDKLKIDRSFVSGLPGDDSDAGIVRAIVQMAGALDMKVIAEGVETAAQRDFLQTIGCDEFQGFLFAPALDPMSFEHRLGRSEPVPQVARQPIRLVRS